ncbi:hypothetical protein SDC9_95824 [bioreactor metagenome]|uniref:NAD-specific glutamate dehydrogenase n=1 Tax=bioreactor metagenome TaxID=1076179 RepID=A0A645A847_9ZZZZ
MADEQRVDLIAVSLGHLAHTLGVVLTVQTVVYGADDDVRLAVQLFENFSGLLHGRGEGHVVVVRGVGLLPDGNVGRVNTEQGHLHAVHVKDLIGVQPARTILLVDVSRQRSALKLLDFLFHIVEPEVELVVSQGPGVIVKIVHGVDHGVGDLVLEFLNVIRLSGVAGVDQEQIGVRLPLRRDDRRRVGHAGLAFLVGRVIIGVDHAVQVAGLENGNRLGFVRRQSGDRQADRHDQSQEQR